MTKKLTAKQVDSDLAPRPLRRRRQPLFAHQGGDREERRQDEGRTGCSSTASPALSTEIGLGKAGKGRVTLVEARAKAAEGRKLLDATPKIDPGAVWRSKPAEKPSTFGEKADALLDRQDERLLAGKNPKHRAQWRKSLGDLPKWFRNIPVGEIGPEDVFKVLDPLWTVTPQTASRLRGRIAKVCDSARGPKGYARQSSRLVGLAEEQAWRGQAARQARPQDRRAHRSRSISKPCLTRRFRASFNACAPDEHLARALELPHLDSNQVRRNPRRPIVGDRLRRWDLDDCLAAPEDRSQGQEAACRAFGRSGDCRLPRGDASDAEIRGTTISFSPAATPTENHWASHRSCILCA